MSQMPKINKFGALRLPPRSFDSFDPTNGFQTSQRSWVGVPVGAHRLHYPLLGTAAFDATATGMSEDDVLGNAYTAPTHGQTKAGFPLRLPRAIYLLASNPGPWPDWQTPASIPALEAIKSMSGQLADAGVYANNFPVAPGFPTVDAPLAAGLPWASTKQGTAYDAFGSPSPYTYTAADVGNWCGGEVLYLWDGYGETYYAGGPAKIATEAEGQGVSDWQAFCPYFAKVGFYLLLYGDTSDPGSGTRKTCLAQAASRAGDLDGYGVTVEIGGALTFDDVKSKVSDFVRSFFNL